MALLKSHSNRTAKQPGYKKTIASFSPCTQSASLPVAKMFQRTTKRKEETKEKMTHSWVSLREQEATHPGHSSHVPPQKAELSYRWVAFPPTLPRTSWFILSSPPTQLSPHFILQSTEVCLPTENIKSESFHIHSVLHSLRIRYRIPEIQDLFWSLGTLSLCPSFFTLKFKVYIDFPHFLVLPRRKGTHFFSLVQTLTKCGNPSSNHCAL